MGSRSRSRGEKPQLRRLEASNAENGQKSIFLGILARAKMNFLTLFLDRFDPVFFLFWHPELAPKISGRSDR